VTYTDLPDQGVVFWPVGTGDSTTIVISAQLVMQVDLRDMKAADEDDAVVAAVIDRLAETLPTNDDGDPYLAVFALTHIDLDHCCGFGDLLDSPIVIGELWATPRMWRELADGEELCEDAVRFQQEAERRVAATLTALAEGRAPVSGDRIRVIGYDDDRDQHSYSQLPDEYFSTPGQVVSTIDRVPVSERFEAFIHAPFRGDCAGERNETSLAMQIQLQAEDGTTGKILLLGDLSYLTIKKIFDYSEEHDRSDRLAFDVMLSSHHCSKKVMYGSDEAGNEERKQDLLDQFDTHAAPVAYVVASSRPFRNKDKPGDNPPHLLAREAYEEITTEPVVCTGEHPTIEDPRPVVFALVPGQGLTLVSVDELDESTSDELKAVEMSQGASTGRSLLAALGVTSSVEHADAVASERPSGADLAQDAVRQARGDDATPPTTIGFGR